MKKQYLTIAIMVICVFNLNWLSIALLANAQTRDRRGLSVKPGKVNSLPASTKRFALIIGVDQYDDNQISKLDGASNDAKVLAQTLIQHAGFPNDQVISLTSNEKADSRPTRGNILRKLSNLKGLVPKDGLLLFSFSGHGIARSGQAYLLPTDAQVSGDLALLEETAINVELIRNWIRQSELSQVLIVLDACRNNPEAARGNSGERLAEAYTKGFNFDIRNSGVTAFATLYATGIGHSAYEFKEKNQGYFTWALVEALKGGAANNEGEVTLAGLIKYLQEVVPKRIRLDMGVNKQQRPFAVVEGYKADELVIAKVMPSWIKDDSGTPESKANIRAGIMRLGTMMEARSRKELQKNPDDAQAHSRLASGLSMQGKLFEAESEAREAVRLEPENADYHADLGRILSRQQKWVEAEIEFRQALRTDPNNTVYHDVLGGILSEQQKWIEAEKEFNESMRLDPYYTPPREGLDKVREKLAEVHNLNGDRFARQSKWAEAETEYKEAVRRKPTDGHYRFSLALALESQQKFAEAEIQYRMAVQFQPYMAHWHYKLAKALEQQQKISEAEIRLKEAIKLDPKNTLYQESLRQLLMKK